MMASFNRVVLIGNMTRAPELRHIPSGLAVTDIGLAVNDRRKTQTGEWVDETSFIDVTIWGRQAEVICQYTTKGSPILVEGRLKQDTWEQEGQKRSKLKVICEKMILLPSPSGKSGRPPGDDGADYSRPNIKSSSGYSSSTPPPQDYYDAPPDGEDVPF
jgi:single-strand DNA-binding protein